MDQFWLEVIGYVASILVAISLTMSSILKLRIINLIGSITFTIYGFLIEAWPVALVNLFIVFVNIYYLLKMRKGSESFHLMEVSAGDDYLKHFLDFHKADVARYAPHFGGLIQKTDIVVFILRDMIPAGLFIGERKDDGTVRAKLDFVIPAYRDFKVGHYLFHESGCFQKHGITEIVSDSGSSVHEAYLKKTGFLQGSDEQYRLRFE